MKDLGIQKSVISEIDTNSAKFKNFRGLNELFNIYLSNFNVPFVNSCCQNSLDAALYPVRKNGSTGDLEYYDGEIWQINTISAGGDPTASTSTTSKYLLTESSDVFTFNGVKMRDIHNTPETLLWKKSDTQLTNNYGVTLSGAVAAGTISVVNNNDQVVVGAGTTTAYWIPNKQFASTRIVLSMEVR